MKDAHEDPIGGHYTRKETTDKIMHVGLWWPTIFQDTSDYCKTCDICQRAGKPSNRDKMPLNPQVTMKHFISGILT